MDKTENLALVFTDQLIANIIIPINQPYALSTLLSLQKELVIVAIFFAFLGSVLGAIINFFFGKLVSKSFFSIETKKITDPKYRKFYYFLLFIPVPVLGSVITFLAGFGQMRFKYFLAAITVMHFCFFLYKVVFPL